MMDYQHIQVNKIAGALGAEISGVDLSHLLSDEVIAEIRKAWLDNLVIFFRNQDITPEQQLAFAERFGEIDIYPMLQGIEGYPQIAPVLKLEHETVNFGGLWHSDTSYLEVPPMAGVLLAREVPPYGGDTLFSNMYMAYEALSPGMKKALEGLVGINSSASAEVSRTREDRVQTAATAFSHQELIGEHPVIRTHPETGKKILYINRGHTQRFKGFTEEESRPILEYLFAHQVRPEFTCRFRWEPGSLAFWDNRSAQHNPVNDYHGYKRLMHRIILKGDKPS